MERERGGGGLRNQGKTWRRRAITANGCSGSSVSQSDTRSTDAVWILRSEGRQTDKQTDIRTDSETVKLRRTGAVQSSTRMMWSTAEDGQRRCAPRPTAQTSGRHVRRFNCHGKAARRSPVGGAASVAAATATSRRSEILPGSCWTSFESS